MLKTKTNHFGQGQGAINPMHVFNRQPATVQYIAESATKVAATEFLRPPNNAPLNKQTHSSKLEQTACAYMTHGRSSQQGKAPRLAIPLIRGQVSCLRCLYLSWKSFLSRSLLQTRLPSQCDANKKQKTAKWILLGVQHTEPDLA